MPHTPPHTARGGRAAPSSCSSSCPPCMSARAPGTCPAPPAPGASPGLRDPQLRGWQSWQRSTGTIPRPTLEPLPAVHRNGNAGNTGNAGMLRALAPCAQRGCSRGHSAPRGQEAPRAVAGGPCPGWDSLYLQAGCRGGTFPAGGAKRCSLLGAPLSPPGGGDQTSPGMRVPSGRSHTGLGQGWDSGPAGATRSLHGLFAQVTPPLPRCPSPPQGSPPSPIPPPVPLCALPVPGPGDPGQQLLSLSQPRCPPLLLLPLSAGGALGTESAPAAPPPWCELGGSAWGDPRRAPWGHCGPAAARDPPAPPGLTPPSSASPPTRLVFKVQHFISVQSSLYSPRSLYQTGCAGVTRRFCNLPEQL